MNKKFMMLSEAFFSSADFINNGKIHSSSFSYFMDLKPNQYFYYA